MKTFFWALFCGLPLAAQPPAGSGILADADSRAYYLYAGSGADVQVFKSKDLAHWDPPATVFRVPSGWASPAQGARDPRVYAYRGKYYLVVTLGNAGNIIAKPPDSWRTNTMQGVQVFVAESPAGPFAPVTGAADKPHTPETFVASGGSLFVEGDIAWLVYAHDWTQMVDASIEAVHLKADLSAPAEDAIYLFKGSDAPWFPLQRAAAKDPRYYPASSPCMWRARDGALLLAWSAPKNGKPAVALARSVTGKVRGPWKQTGATLLDNSAQPTIFQAFDGRLLLMTADEKASKFTVLEEAGGALRVKAAAPAKKGAAR
jgi:hypothetical protein